MKTIIYKILLMFLLLILLIAAPESAFGQDTTLVRSTISVGAGWSSGGNYTTFGIAGQSAVSTRLAETGSYTGNIGFLFSPPPAAVENLPPVAISPTVEFVYELGNSIFLDGFDPELQPIEFEVTTEPTHGTLVGLDALLNREFRFEPATDLEPDLIYHDTIKFKVKEQNTSLESEIGVVAFQFSIEDQPHQIDTLKINGNTFTLEILDALFNDAYTLDLNYYDLTDPTDPQIVNFQSGSIEKADLTIDGSIGSYDFNVSETEHDYLFTADQVLVTVLVATENGFSSFESYIVDNSSSGRTAASADGKFFVIGSELSVPENQTVLLKMIAVDFADVDVSQASFEWLTSPFKGSIGTVSAVEQSATIVTWEAEYTSTEDIGGKDSIEFQVFNPVRNEFQSGFVKINIADVNDLPTLDPIADQQMNEDGTLDVSLTFSDPDNELEVFVASNETSNLLATVSGGTVNLTGLNNFSGQVNVTVWVKEVGTVEEYLRLQSFDVEILPVNDPPVVQQVSDIITEEDNNINVSLSASDPDVDFQIFEFSAIIDDPSIASVEVEGSLLKILPFENAFGTVNVTVRADDGSGSENSLSADMSFSAEFTPVNDAPVIAQQLETQVLVQDFPGYDVDLSANFSDPETDAANLLYSVANNTSVLVTFTNSVATITLASGFSGVEDIDITASDGVESVTMNVTFVVNDASPDLIVSNAVSTINLEEDFGQYTLDVSTVFEDTNDAGAVFEYDLAGLTFLSATIDNSTGQITFSSAENYSGTESLVLIGTTGGVSTFTTFDIVTAAVNDAPVLQSLADQSIKEDAELSGLVVAIEDVDNDAGDLTLTVTSADQTKVADGDISVTSVNGFYLVDIDPIANANGFVTINVVASDGSLQDNSSFELELVPVNDLPENIASISDATEDVLKSVDVSNLYQDLDGDALTFTVENLPSWLTQAGNIISGTPTNAEVGTHQITVVASDAAGDVRNTFSLVVVNVNDAPTIKQPVGSTTTFSNQEFTYSFPEGNFEDVDAGDNLTFTIEGLPSWAANMDNTIVGTPAESDAGTHLITFRATDLSGASVTDILSVIVENAVYNATVTLAADAVCSGGTSIVTATGAFEYNWYDSNDELLQSGGATYEFQPASNTRLFVEGVDGQGNVTADRFEIEVVVNPIPDVTVTEGKTLSIPEQAGASYQWYLNDMAIDGATNASYEPDEEGEYYVIATFGTGCEATSARVTFEILGIEGPGVQIDLYPVPTNDWLNLISDLDLSTSHFRIVGVDGKLSNAQPLINGGKIRFDVTTLPPGIYFLHVSNDDFVRTIRFIKN